MNKKQYELSTGIIQIMILQGIFSKGELTTATPEELAQIDNMLTEWNGYCNQANGYKIKLTIEA